MKSLRGLLPLVCLLMIGCTHEGATVYQKNCAGCHKRGQAGAPRTGDIAVWKDRIAQGEEVLVRHSIQGYTGRAGIMPARGGNPNLTDAQVRDAVRFMIEESQ